MEFKQLFSAWIKDVLSTSETNQKQLAKILGVKESNLSNWKSGLGLPSLEIFCKLCYILEISADEFLDKTKNLY